MSCRSQPSRGFTTRPERGAGPGIRCALPGAGCLAGIPSGPRHSETLLDGRHAPRAAHLRPQPGAAWSSVLTTASRSEYVKAIRGTLTYDEMLTAYRCYDVMLNVNTITESPSMFARRVFESLACGTPVVSQDSMGMRKMLGEHVRVTRSAEETAGHIEELLGDEEARSTRGAPGLPPRP